MFDDIDEFCEEQVQEIRRISRWSIVVGAILSVMVCGGGTYLLMAMMDWLKSH